MSISIHPALCAPLSSCFSHGKLDSCSPLNLVFHCATNSLVIFPVSAEWNFSRPFHFCINQKHPAPSFSIENFTPSSLTAKLEPLNLPPFTPFSLTLLIICYAWAKREERLNRERSIRIGSVFKSWTVKNKYPIISKKLGPLHRLFPNRWMEIEKCSAKLGQSQGLCCRETLFSSAFHFGHLVRDADKSHLCSQSRSLNCRPWFSWPVSDRRNSPPTKMLRGNIPLGCSSISLIDCLAVVA